MLIHPSKNPLGPFIKGLIRGIDFPIPIIKRTNFVELPFYIFNVRPGAHLRMGIGLNGIVFRRQAKGIPSHGMKDLIALQNFITADNITEHIAAPVTNMQTRTRGIGKHIQAVILWFFVIIHIHLMFFPMGPPFFFNGRKIILCFHGFLLVQSNKALHLS